MAKKEALLQAAEKLVSKGKIEAAIKEYKKVLKRSGEDTNTLNRIGDLYARLRKNDNAIEYYGKTAESYSGDGFYVKAIAVYKKIHRLEPGRLDAHSHLAELYHRQGLSNEARSHYQHLADHYLRQRDAASAISVYQKMIELEPSNPTPRAKLAELYKQEKLTSKAIAEYGNIARTMIEHQQAEQALQVYMRALDLEVPDNEFLQAAISNLMSVGHTAGAEELFNAALQRNPGVEELRVLLAGLPGAVPASPSSPPEPSAPTPPADSMVAEPEPAQEVTPATADAAPVPDPTQVPGATTAAQELPAEGTAAMEHETLAPEALPPAAEQPVAQQPVQPPVSPPVAQPPTAQPPVAEAPAPDPQLTQLQPQAPSEALQPPPSTMPAEGQGEEFEEFVLDFDGDEAPSTMVQPPADMVDSGSIESSVGDEIEIEIEAPSIDPQTGAEEWAFEPEPELEPPTYSPEDMELELTDSQLQPQAVLPSPTPTQEPAEPPIQEPAPLPSSAPQEPQPPPMPAEPSPLQAPPAAATQPAAAQPEEPAAAQPGEPAAVQPLEPARAEDDLLAEAEVFVKYGLSEKAIDRLRDVLASNPSHLGAHGQLISLYVQQGSHQEVAPLAARMAQLAHQAGTLESWNETREMLQGSGYQLDGDTLLSLPGADSAEPVTAAPAALPEMPPSAPAPLSSDALPEQAVDLNPPASAFDTFDSTLATQSAPAAPPSGPAVEHDPSAWLNELDEPTEAAAQEGETLFDDEESFFDLAAELQDDLKEGASEPGTEPHEQSLEEIVEGFKKGVAENLSPEDSDTHYNLGIAYREMMLFDEAIGEFQIAAKDPRYLVDCCAMLGQCFSEKGLPELAVKWFQRGLESPSIDEKQVLGMLYDLGNCYIALDDRGSAYKTFVEIYGMNSNYRDVSARMMELQPSGTTN